MDSTRHNHNSLLLDFSSMYFLTIFAVSFRPTESAASCPITVLPPGPIREALSYISEADLLKPLMTDPEFTLVFEEIKTLAVLPSIEAAKDYFLKMNMPEINGVVDLKALKRNYFSALSSGKNLRDFPDIPAVLLGIAKGFVALRDEFLALDELGLQDRQFLMQRFYKAAGLLSSSVWDPQDMDLSNFPLEDLTPLSYLTSLSACKLDGTQVKDISALSSLSNLWFLSLKGTLVDDVTPLASLSRLNALDLSNTLVENICPLYLLTGLRALDLSHTLVTDLSPLSELTSLEFLKVTGVEADRAALQALRDVGLQIIEGEDPMFF